MIGNEVTIGEALIVTIFSMAIVFAALIVISFILDGFRTVFHKDDKKEDKVSENMRESRDSSFDKKNVSNTENDEELIAVITAAIAASTSKSPIDIRISNIRRVAGESPIWARVGRQEQTQQF